MGAGVVVGRTNGWSFIGCIRPDIKLIHPRWKLIAKGRKTRCILFNPLLSTTYFISWPFCDTTIHSLPRSRLSLWHTLRTYPPSSFIHICTHTQPTRTCYCWLGIYIAFRVKKQLRLNLGAGLHHSCAQTAHYGCTVVRPLVQTGLRIHSKLWHTEQSWFTSAQKKDLFICFSCISMNDQTRE